MNDRSIAVNMVHALSSTWLNWRLGALLALTLAALTLMPSVALAQSPPNTPSAVTVTRADGTLTASGYAVSGATKYHITYTTDGGGSWHAPASTHTNWTYGSITFDADNAKTYIVGVRAGNDSGWSGWRNSASAGPYTPPQPTPTPEPTPTPSPQPPSAVAFVSLTRADGTVTADWNAVSGAAHYHITYTTDNGQSWSLAAMQHTSSSITIGSADNSKSYIVGVRAGNTGGWSGWRNSPSIAPFTPQPTPTATPTPTPTPDPAAGIIVQDTSGNAITALSVPEGGEASYQVKLASQPAQAVEVRIALSVRDNNDPDITFKGEASDVVALKLPFTPENWNTAQTVTLVAAEDNDYADGARDLDHDTRSFGYIYFPGRVWLAVTEIDNDEPPPAAPTGLTATAGDGSVTLTWNDPADSSITGYEYRTRWAGVAWGAWTAIADSDSDTTSHTLTGLTNGTEYRFKLRAVNAGGVSKPAPQSSPWYAAATPRVPPPDAPTNVTVSVNINVMTVSWNAVSGADGYDVRTKTGSADWVIVASNVSGTTTDIDILEIPNYTGVRTRDGNAVSAWTDVSRLPPPDIFGSSASGAFASAQAQSQGVQAQSQGVQAQNTLAAPANVTVTRSNGGPTPYFTANDSLTVKWDAVPGATGYRIACIVGDDYVKWRKCGKDGSNWKVYGTSAGTTGVTVDYTNGLRGSSNTGAWVRLPYQRPITVVVQALKDGTPGNWSAPYDAYPAFPLYLMSSEYGVPGNYEMLKASSRTATGFTLAWTHPSFAAGYVAECAKIPSGRWAKCSEDSNAFSEQTVNGNAITVAQAQLYGSTLNDRIINGVTVNDLDLAKTGTQTFDPWKSYAVRVRTTNPSGQSEFSSPPPSTQDPYYNLTAISVTDTGARLFITNYTAAWWYERTSPSGDSTCHSVTAGTSSVILSSLNPGTSYTYKAYDATGCNSADEKASVTFTTP